MTPPTARPRALRGLAALALSAVLLTGGVALAPFGDRGTARAETAAGVYVGSAAAPDVAVVVNPKTPVDSLTMPELRKVLLGDRQFWSPGQRITLLIRAPVSQERDVVLKKIYQMSEAQFRQYWIAKVFRAEVPSGPKVVYSDQTAIELVQSLPGSIAFVTANQVPRGLKVLKIDGHLPGEKSYPL